MSNQIQPVHEYRPHGGHGRGRRRMNPRMVMALIAGLYTISPIDVIPDVIPVAGQADDVMVIMLAVVAMLVMTMMQNSGEFYE